MPDIGPGTIDYHEGDADITSALDAIYSMDTNFFQVFSIYRSKTDIKEIAAWIEGKNLKYTFSTESADVKNLISTNVFAELAALNYSQTSGHWIHDAGVDAAGVAITVADEVATVTRAAHGLRVEDSLTVSGATPAGLNGNKTVASVIDVDNFTYDATGVIDGAATGTINYFARYSFHEVAVEALMFGEDEGTETGLGTASWANKQITGSTATPDSILTSARALQIVELYNGNVYKELKGFAQTIGGKSFSGRTIKVQTVADWIEVRLQESSLQLLIAVKQLLYTNSDIAKINNAWSEPLNTQLTRGGITPLDDIRPYSIVLPRSNAVPAADKLNNTIHGVATVRAGTEILSFDLTVNMTI